MKASPKKRHKRAREDFRAWQEWRQSLKANEGSLAKWLDAAVRGYVLSASTRQPFSIYWIDGFR